MTDGQDASRDAALEAARETGLPHRSVQIEARVHTVVERNLRTRGWSPRVFPHTGYAGTTWARVLGRVLLVPPGGPRQAREDRRGWRRFVTTSAGGIPVTIRIGSETHVVTSGHDGYLDVLLPAELEPGWATALLSVGDAEPVAASLRVVGPATRLGMVSDVDDTVIQTMLPRPLVAFRNAFLVRENARRTVSGMAELYREIGEAHPDVFVVYLSTGAWNTAPALTSFLTRHDYPPGPLLLTDWGPTPQGWFRSGQDHKRAQLARLFAELPDLQWLLVGDDGQHDPTLYAEAATAHPDKVLGIAIRELSTTEHVVVHGTPVAPTGNEDGIRTPVSAPDGFGLRAGLRARGLLPG